MIKKVVQHLECPICHKALEWKSVEVTAANQPEVILVGTLVCETAHCFAVEEGCALLRAEDEGRIGSAKNSTPTIALPEGQELEKLLADRIRVMLPWDKATTARSRKRLENDFQYRLSFASKKKYLPMLSHIKEPKVVCEVGSGQGGFLTDLRERFPAADVMGIEYDPEWAKIAALRDPSTTVLVADARNMPIKENAIDLLTSVYAMEHIPRWWEFMRELKRTSKQALLLFGPNKWFPWDLGHAPEVPFLPMLPFWMRVFSLYVMKRILGYPLSWAETVDSQREMSYISPRSFTCALKTHELHYSDRFMEFVDLSLASSFNYWSWMKYVKRFQGAARFLLKLMNKMGVHPVLVYRIEKNLS